jgi:hypothetical protein
MAASAAARTSNTCINMADDREMGTIALGEE